MGKTIIDSWPQETGASSVAEFIGMNDAGGVISSIALSPMQEFLPVPCATFSAQRLSQATKLLALR